MSIYLAVGRRQLGKSTLARYMAHAKSPRLFVDPRAQWRAGTIYRHADEDAILEDFAAGRDVIVQPAEKQKTIDRLASVARVWFDEEMVEAPGAPARELSVVLDEAGTYRLDAWDWFLRTCDVRRTIIVLTAHRPQDIDTSVRAIADAWCIFRTTQTHDLKAIEDRTSERVVQEVQRLQPFEFVEWDDAKAEMRLHKNPAAWREPAGARLEGRIVESVRVRHLWE